jgi:hypothetical protein
MERFSPIQTGNVEDGDEKVTGLEQGCQPILPRPPLCLPRSQKLCPRDQIVNKVWEVVQRGIRGLHPAVGNGILLHGFENVINILGYEVLAVNATECTLQALSHGLEQVVVLLQFLFI